MQTQPNDLPVLVEVSVGELLDKITILEIKREKIRDAKQAEHVRSELDALIAARQQRVAISPEIAELAHRLRQVNLALWEVEDAIRERERLGDFGARFVELARSVYRQNDLRADLKQRINLLAKSRIFEAKQYCDY